MKCRQCLANIPDGVNSCPKCGGTVFTSGEGSNGGHLLRNVVQIYCTPIPFYTKAKLPCVVDDELTSFEVEWKLYRARLQPNAPSIFLWDRDGYLPGKQEAALSRIPPSELAEIFKTLPQKKLNEIKRIVAEEWGLQLETSDLEGLVNLPIFFQPVPKLKDPKLLEGMDWRSYVQGLACPKPGKDPKLVVVHLAKILCPMHMRYAPHSLEITNSGTGKTRFYDAAGIKIDKATRKAVLGFAKSPTEVFPGTIHGTSLPTAFDQIESQDSFELAKYMLDILEVGRALVDAGGVRFPVETASSFAYLANPIAKDERVVEGFKALLNHVCVNPAMGRRFGIILFATNLKTIKGGEKMTVQELEDWKRSFTLFRAVEEYCQPKVKALIRNPKVAEWLHKPIKGYRETILKSVEELDDPELKAFFEAHAEAEHRVRGAALHTAVALLLDKIALDKLTVDELLEEAEDWLGEYIKINLESISSLCAMWDKLKVDQAKAFYDNCPDYLQEIISACIHHKRHNPDAVTVRLDEIPYEPENRASYQYFSRCITKLKQRKNLSSLNTSLRSFFGFQIEREGDVFTVTYFQTTHPPDDLKLIGKYGVSNKLVDFSEPQPSEEPFNRFNRFNHLTGFSDTPSSVSGFSASASARGGVSEKPVKRLKRLNRLNGVEVVGEPLEGVCEFCGKQASLVIRIKGGQRYACKTCLEDLKEVDRGGSSEPDNVATNSNG
ncbi:MAG: hypothetical protein QW341_03590 [Candidatus Bathyarchaeia archaeon]